jgi:hypothetical protein
MPTLKAMGKVLTKLVENGIPHYPWTDPDLPYGLTAVCTSPLRGDQRKVLANYRVYAPGVLMSSTSASKAESGGSNPPGSASLQGGGTEASV